MLRAHEKVKSSNTASKTFFYKIGKMPRSTGIEFTSNIRWNVSVR